MNFDLSVIYTRPDGSYVINQGLYHVPNEGDYVELWEQVDAYAKEHPEVVQEEPPEPEYVPTQEEIEAQVQATLTQVVQNALDNFAKTRNYDGILSVCSYANSTNPKFKAEADYCVQLRDDTWAAGYIILDQVKSGFRAVPTAEELIALLPVSSAKWPNEQ